ncbi:MAG: hypothetical protein AAFS01_05430 [Pseudomonadota bacterium]
MVEKSDNGQLSESYRQNANLPDAERTRIALIKAQSETQRARVRAAVLEGERLKIEMKIKIAEGTAQRTEEVEAKLKEWRTPRPVPVPSYMKGQDGRTIPLSQADKDNIAKKAQDFAHNENAATSRDVDAAVDKAVADYAEREVKEQGRAVEGFERARNQRESAKERIRKFKETGRDMTRQRGRDRGMGD